MIYTNDSLISKYSNYVQYRLGSQSLARPIDEIKLHQLIMKCKKSLSKPYFRFMYKSGEGEPYAVVYDGDIRMTKLISFSEIEEMIASDKFTK